MGLHPKLAIEKLQHNIETIKQLWPLSDQLNQILEPWSVEVGVDYVDRDKLLAFPVVSTREEMADILRAVGGLGWRQTGTPRDQTGHRWYTLRLGGHLLQLAFGFSGDKCRMVKVGERTEPILQLQCSGD